MPQHSAPSGEYQRTFNFPPPDYHSPRDPAAPRRTEAAKEILARSSATEIRVLIERGQVSAGTHAHEIPVMTFVRDNREALRQFVQRLANGTFSRDLPHQRAAWELLGQFNNLADLPLALQLKELGLCDSTKSFGREVGSFRYLLFKFRRAMDKFEKQTK